MRLLITGFAHCLRSHLQQGARLHDVPGFGGEDAAAPADKDATAPESNDDPDHVPAYLVSKLVVPWATINDFGLMSVPILAFAAFAGLSAEGVADTIEHPFDERAGLHMEKIVAAIETSVTGILSPAGGQGALRH